MKKIVNVHPHKDGGWMTLGVSNITEAPDIDGYEIDKELGRIRHIGDDKPGRLEIELEYTPRVNEKESRVEKLKSVVAGKDWKSNKDALLHLMLYEQGYIDADGNIT